MTSNNDAMRKWAQEHHTIFDALSAALLGATEQAARVGHDLNDGNPVTTSLAILERNAAHLLSLVHDAQEFPPFPDNETSRHFSAALARWEDAAQALITVCERQEPAEVERTAKALDAGTDEFYRAAAAIGRATGQPTDPANPKN
jgi:hypothetical protein